MAIAPVRGQRLPRGWRHLRRVAVAGALNILLPFSAISWGTQHIPSGGAALSYAGATVYAMRQLTGYAPFVASLGRIGGGWLMVVPLSLHVDAPWRLTVSARALVAAALRGALGTAIACLICRGLVPRVGATRTSLTTHAVPLLACCGGG